MAKKDAKSARFSSGLLGMKFMQKSTAAAPPPDAAGPDARVPASGAAAESDPGEWSFQTPKPRKTPKKLGYSDIYEPVNARKSYGSIAKRKAEEPDERSKPKSPRTK